MKIKSELKDAQIENRIDDVTHDSSIIGLTWFNTALNKLKSCFTSENKIIATEDFYTNKIPNGIILEDLATPPTTPGANSDTLYYSEGELRSINDQGEVSRLGFDSFFEFNQTPLSFTINTNATTDYTFTQTGIFIITAITGPAPPNPSPGNNLIVTNHYVDFPIKGTGEALVVQTSFDEKEWKKKVIHISEIGTRIYSFGNGWSCTMFGEFYPTAPY